MSARVLQIRRNTDRVLGDVFAFLSNLSNPGIEEFGIQLLCTPRRD